MYLSLFPHFTFAWGYKIGFLSNVLEMNHTISFYHIEWRVVDHFSKGKRANYFCDLL